MSSLPVFAQGAGARAGRFRVHPEARLEGRFDNNLYRQDSTEGGTSAGYLRLMPSLRITNPFPGSVALDGSLGLELRQYLDSTVNDQQDSVGLNLAAGATLGRGKAFSLSINQDLRRQVEPGQGASQQQVEAAEVDPSQGNIVEGGCISPCSLSFWRNTTRLQGRFAPGGGRLVFAPSYKFMMTRFDAFDSIDKDTHEIRAGASYRFFPRTSLVMDGSYQIIDYTEEQVEGLSSISPLRVKAGLRGLITTKLATTLTAGWGTTNADSGEDYSSFIAMTELVYAVTQGLRARLQYARDFEDSSFSNFVQTDRIGVKLQSKLGGNFNANADFAVNFRNYSQGFLVGTEDGTVRVADDELSGRSDTFYTANVAGSYHPSEWLVVTGGYRLEQNDTSFGVAVGAIDNFAAFARHQFFLGVGLLL